MEQLVAGEMRAELSRLLAARRGRGIGLRVIPMIDLFFLLLAFFILTGSYRQSDDYLPFTLPAAGGAGGVSVVEPLILTIDARGSGCGIRIGQSSWLTVSENGTPDMSEFAQSLKSTMDRQRRNASDPVEIICRDTVQWQYIVRVYDVLYGMGISDITFRMTE